MSAHQSSELNLRQAFHELNKAERTGDYERVLKTCNRILKTEPNDPLALRYKVLSLIHLSKFEEDLQFIRKITSQSFKLKTRDVGDFVFEKAYCEYRMNRAADALKTLRDAGGELDFRCKELMAQLLYRLEEYEECYRLYRELVRNSADEFDNERKANLLAVCSQLMYTNQHQPEVQSVAADSFEQLYNSACGLIAINDYAEALNILDKAEAMGLKEEDRGEDELTTVKLQKAFCLHMLKKVDDAAKIYTAVLDLKPTDPTLTAIASNNVVCIRKDQNLFDSRKKLKLCQTHQLAQKFTSRQRASVCLNNALLMYFSNQFDSCRRGIEELRAVFKAEKTALLCEAALLRQQKKPEEAVVKLEEFVTRQKDACPQEVKLAVVQLYLNEGKAEQACDCLMSLGEDFVYAPGVLSLITALYLANDDVGAASSMLSKAVDRLMNDKSNEEVLTTLLEECAALYSRLGDQKTALRYLENLKSIRPNDRSILARLMNAYMLIDERKALKLSSELPSVSSLITDLNIDYLETASWLTIGSKYGAKKAARTEAASPKTNNAKMIVKARKHKRKRKVKLPKNYDPSVPPDPERWLPKYERAAYKKRKDKRAREREIGRGTQGVVTDNPEAETATFPENVTNSPKSPLQGLGAGAQNVGPRQMHPAPQKPKKKKKERKL